MNATANPRIVIATTNVKKGAEMARILEGAGLAAEFLTLDAFPGAPEVEETGETFSANALLKAAAAARFTGAFAVADDGGLIIDALDGLPGVKSHRFLGADTPFPAKMNRILELMRDVPEERRTCRFECAVAIVTPEGETAQCSGVCEGRIAHEMKGCYGFGYDPIFYVPDLGMHMAELPPEMKQKISHRGKALGHAIVELRRLCGL